MWGQSSQKHIKNYTLLSIVSTFAGTRAGIYSLLLSRIAHNIITTYSLTIFAPVERSGVNMIVTLFTNSLLF